MGVGPSADIESAWGYAGKELCFLLLAKKRPKKQEEAFVAGLPGAGPASLILCAPGLLWPVTGRAATLLPFMLGTHAGL